MEGFHESHRLLQRDDLKREELFVLLSEDIVPPACSATPLLVKTSK